MTVSRREDILDRLRQFESPNVTYLPEEGQWPIVWERAKGMKVWDVDGKEYLDFTAAFGVTAAGHAPPSVVRAGKHQMGKLLHAMGDVHPHALKAALAQKLSELTFGRWNHEIARGKVVFCNSGFETIEVALKSACQATGRNRILSFEGAYHGLGYGALLATHRSHFRGEFGAQLAEIGDSVPFPGTESDLAAIRESLTTILKRGQTGALLVEPIQGRGGINLPPAGFLPMLRNLCDEYGTMLIFDEIYTGFGRTGHWFACESESVVPDFICLGKALTGGFPLSALVGRADLMDRAWPKSSGEAIHTSTYLGHPVGCAMALAQLDLIESRNLVDRSARVGKSLKRLLEKVFGDRHPEVAVRGRGLMIGVELRDAEGMPDTHLSLGIIEALLDSGYILLPDGEFGNVVGITPSLIVSSSQIKAFVSCFQGLYQKIRNA
jgi:4-aminobutyrate aminotransferase-like enzyme